MRLTALPGAFGQRTAYLVLNVGAAVKLQQSKYTLAERILSEADVHAMLVLEPGRRTQVLRPSVPAGSHCAA